MTFPTDAAIITRRKSLGISIAMCGSYYFKALPRIFSALFSRGARFVADVYRRELCIRPQRLASGGILNHPRRAPTALGTASHRSLLPVCPGAKARKVV